MSREVKRVPVGFGWPLNKVWAGFEQPAFLKEDLCPDCQNGYSREAWQMHQEWYGNVPFNPASQGSAPFPHTHPKIWAFAKRNCLSAPEYYGSDMIAVDREARRLARLWNGMWAHHLNQEDVDLQIADGQLHELTHAWTRADGWVQRDPMPTYSAREVNEMYLGSALGGPSQWVSIVARCEREGVPFECATCGGRASVEAFKGQRKAAKRWRPVKVPSGRAWQIWETVSEGSPITPAFETPEALADHYAAQTDGDRDGVLQWILGPGWAPSAVVGDGGLLSAEQIISNGGL